MHSIHDTTSIQLRRFLRVIPLLLLATGALALGAAPAASESPTSPDVVRVTADAYTNPGAEHAIEVAPPAVAAQRAGLQATPPLRVTGASPYAASCGTTPDPDTEVEFSLAADRARPERLVGAWIQRAARAPAVAYSRDGGATWNVVVPPGLAACTGSDYLRSTDPWLGVGPDGVAYLVTLPAMSPAIQVSRSNDTGATWSFPVFVERRTEANRPDDKPTLAADPYRAGSVYVSWSRLRVESTPTCPTVFSSVEFSRSRDGARTWSAANTIDTPPAGWTDVIAQVLVPSPGQLLVVFSRRQVADNTGSPLPGGRVEFYATRSDDGGDSWSAPVLIGEGRNLSLADPETSTPIRSGLTPVFNAAAGTDGRAYVAWTDVLSEGASQLTIVGTRDGGRSWSPPHRLAKPSDRPMNPDVAVADNGSVALRFYDLREDEAGDEALSTRSWLRVSRNGHGFGREIPLGGVFDLRTAPVATGFTPGRFLGEYQGLVGVQEGFAVLFAQAQPQAQIGATDGFFSRVALSPTGPPRRPARQPWIQRGGPPLRAR
jgi:BNR repeat-like domain